MVGDVDKIALWNIVTTVDAYLSAGFTPAEILEAVHPSMVASTQGTGFGGMASMRKLYLDRFLNHEIPTDILQEALPNVVAAHVMQSYIGGYGNMVQPVSACATAAVSLEEGADKIALGKADFVVTGAIDDIGVESVIGFGNMNATANSEEMYAKGIDARFFSRANDRRRGGFVESQGGGTILNVASSAGLLPGGPYMAGYYASKAYVVSLTRGVARELQELHSPVYVCALCPGPVDTEFNDRAGVVFALKGITPEFCVQEAMHGMMHRRTIIVPSAFMRACTTAQKLLPASLLMPIVARQQKKKLG